MIVGVEVGVVGPKGAPPTATPPCASIPAVREVVFFVELIPPFSVEIRCPFDTFGGRGLQLRAWLGVKKGGNNAPPPATPP